MHPNDGNKHREIHGAAAGERALATGDNFSGLALEAAGAVESELAEIGAVGMLRRNAIRFGAVESLLYARMLACTNPAELDSIVKRWGWIAAHSRRAWRDVVEMEREKEKGITPDQILDAIRLVRDENND